MKHFFVEISFKLVEISFLASGNMIFSKNNSYFLFSYAKYSVALIHAVSANNNLYSN